MTIKPDVKVLIIDDMKTLLLTYKKMLKTLGLSNISSAFDGDMGWKMIREAYEKIDKIDFLATQEVKEEAKKTISKVEEAIGVKSYE